MSAATGATNGFRKIGVVNGKTASRRAVDKIDLRSVEVRVEFLLRYQNHIAELVPGIDIGVEFRVKMERILNSATSAADDTDPQKSCGIEILRLLDS